MTSSLELHGMYSYDDDVYIRDQLIKHVVITLFVIVIYPRKASFASQLHVMANFECAAINNLCSEVKMCSDKI